MADIDPQIPPASKWAAAAYAVKELRLASFAVLLCFVLLGAIVWVAYDLGGKWVSLEGQQIEINRQQVENIKRLVEMIEKSREQDAKQHEISVRVLEKLAEAISRQK